MEIHQLTSDQVFKHFISDCLLPCLDHAVSASVLFDLWSEYCKSIGYAPSTIHNFGRLMASRFQRSTRRGRSFYYCEIKPEIFKEEPNGSENTTKEETSIS